MVRSLKSNGLNSVWLFLCLLIFSGVFNVAYAARLKVTLDRDVVSLNDSFTIFFQAVGSVDDDPDFSPLEKDFSIIGKQKRSNFSIINGKRNSNAEWLVEVTANRDGVLQIPAINFGKDQSPSTQVRVKNAPVLAPLKQSGQAGQDDSDDEIFIEVEAIPEHSWVQSQIIYTIRLFRSVNTFNSSLSEPKISSGKMIAEMLEDRQFEMSRNNKRYIVLQRRYALFPQASGAFELEPIVFKGQISQQSRHLFDPFGRNSLSVQRLSRSIKLNIKPVPADYTATTWLPAKSLKVQEKWVTDPHELVAGEPVTRTIVIKADGLTSEQLPEIILSDLENFKHYPDQPELHNQTSRDGVLGIRQEKSALIPNKAGEFVLPAVEITWWNTQTAEMEIAQLPERVITVLPGSGKESPAQLETTLNADPSPEATTTKPASKQEQGYWFWVSLFLTLGWLSTLLFWWSQNRQKDIKEDSDQVVLTERSSIRNLREAIRKDDPVLIKDALLNWAKSVWKENPPTNLTVLGEYSGQPLSDELTLLNQSLYGKTDQRWNSERLLLAVENFDGLKLQEQRTKDQQGLKPLHNI